MAAEALRGFPKTIQTVLREGKTDCAMKMFDDNRYADNIKNDSWDLIPVISEHITEENRCKNNELFKCCVFLLGCISEKSNSEEALLQFISEIEEAKENAKVFALLEPLYKVIVRIPVKKVNSLAWSFNAIHTYLSKCELPSYDGLEGKERLLVDNNAVASNITRLYREIVIFYIKFMDTLQETNDGEVRSVLCKFLVQLLGSPLCYLTMESFDTIKTDGRVLAEDVVCQVLKTQTDPFALTEMRFESDQMIKPDTLSTANLFYLIYHEKICFEVVPKVYNFEYVFQTSLHLLVCFIEKNNVILTEKALKLAQSVFGPMNTENFSFMLLDSEDHCEFCKVLFNIIIYDQSETIRKTSLSVLEAYLKSFEPKGVYLILTNAMGILSHSGLKGYLIMFYKNLMCKSFTDKGDEMSDYFKGPRLFSLLRKFCHLADNEETNLMENSDQIISTLNLVRYLALRDKANVTEFREFCPTLEQIFLGPLRTALEISKAHYELEIKNVNTQTSQKQDKVDVLVTASGQNLPKMDREEKLRVLNSSLTAFDVMQSLLTRVTELIENRP